MEYFRGDLESAQRQTQAAQIQYLQVGHQLGVGHSYGNLGMIADAAGDDDAAIGLYEHALATFRELGDRTCMGYMLGNLGLVLGVVCAAGLIWYFRRRGKPAASAPPQNPPPT